MNCKILNNNVSYVVKTLLVSCVLILASPLPIFAYEKMWDSSGFEPEEFSLILQLSKSEWEQVATEMARDEGSNGRVENSEGSLELIIVNSNRNSRLSFLPLYMNDGESSKPFALKVGIHFTRQSMLVKYQGNFTERAIEEFREVLGPEYMVTGHHDSSSPSWDGVELEIQSNVP